MIKGAAADQRCASRTDVFVQESASIATCRSARTTRGGAVCSGVFVNPERGAVSQFVSNHKFLGGALQVARWQRAVRSAALEKLDAFTGQKATANRSSQARVLADAQLVQFGERYIEQELFQHRDHGHAF